MKTNQAIENDSGNAMAERCSATIGTKAASNVEPILENQAGVSSEPMRLPTTNTEAESFFAEPTDPRQEALALASEVIRRLLIWMADGRTLEERGLRACVALYCIRPDLIDGATLDRIGVLAERSRQAVHKLANEFRQTTGLQA
jgi:hypothetical protein